MGRGNGDGGCADKFKAGVLGFEQFDVRSATVGPELEEDVRAVGVDGIHYLWDGSFRGCIPSGCERYEPSSRLGPEGQCKYMERYGAPLPRGGLERPRLSKAIREMQNAGSNIPRRAGCEHGPWWLGCV